MNTRKWARTVAAFMVVAGVFSGCSTTPGAEEPLNVTGEEVAVAPGDEPEPQAVAESPSSEKKLRVGIYYDYPGMGLMNPETGIPTGFEVDIAAYIAWKLGYSPFDIEWVQVIASNRIPMLENGDVDFMVAAISMNEERAATIDFAGPYLLAGQDLLVRANDTTINGVSDLAGKTLCMLPTTTGEERLRELFGAEVNFIYEENYMKCIGHVVDGVADATSTDDAILAGHASIDDFYRLVRVVGSPFSEERYGIGLPQNSHNLCLQVNRALTDMVEDGSWEKFIYRNVAGTHYFPDRYENPPVLDQCE